MRSVTTMRAAKIGYIVMSLLYCAMGALLLFTPETSIRWTGRLLSVFAVIFGSVKLVGYFSRDLFRLAFQYDLAFGLLLIVLGVVALLHPGDTLSFAAMLFGIPVLADGLFKLQIAMDARRFGLRRWWLICALAVLTGVIGAVLVLRPADGAVLLTMLLGVSLLLDGALNLSVAICAVKIVDHQQPDILESDDF